MPGDLLSRWLAIQGAGTVSRLRRTYEWLARSEDAEGSPMESGRWVRDLSALGHLEVDWDKDRWATAPLVITRIPAGNGLALLTGCRSGACDASLDDSTLAVHRLPQPQMSGLPRPSVVLMQYDTVDDLHTTAKELGARYVPCASEQLASRLPTPQLGQPAAEPSRRNETLERLNARLLSWEPADSVERRQGAYRYEYAGRRQYLFLTPGGWRHCDLPTAVFTALQQTTTTPFRWRADLNGSGSGSLFVDWGAPLPTLHQRCLVLCSGFVPRFSANAHTAAYDNVPRSIAEAVSASLGQTLDMA